tara:strand:+ start:225 stop:977 length:753 start_codon:yes stop_codon:yes gene_type:complete
MKPQTIDKHIKIIKNWSVNNKELISEIIKDYFKAVELNHYTNDELRADLEAEKRKTAFIERMEREYNMRSESPLPWEKTMSKVEYKKKNWIEYLNTDKRKAQLGRFFKDIYRTPAAYLSSKFKKKTESPTTAVPAKSPTPVVSAQLGFFEPKKIDTPPSPMSVGTFTRNGGKNKRKVYFVNKINVLGKQKKVYKFVGNKKKYIKYKNKYVLLKKYKEMQMKKTKVKKAKVKKTKVKKTKVKKTTVKKTKK